jgi:hypothetical protein
MLPGNTTDKTTRRFTRVDHVGDHVGMAAGVLALAGQRLAHVFVHVQPCDDPVRGAPPAREKGARPARGRGLG